MQNLKEQSTFLIKSTKNQSFGTAFCIEQDSNGSFLLTCQHVIEACGKEDLEVNGKNAELQVSTSTNELIDLAVVYVKGLEAKPLKLSLATLSEDSKFIIDGFKPHKAGEYKQEELDGSIKKISQIHAETQSIDSYELYIGEDDNIEKGYSGSAIVSKNSGQVVAVATDRTTTGKQAYAIPLKYLKEVWAELDPKLFDTITPFVGLSAFGRQDSAYFFGRDREIEEILTQLKSSSILAVIGDSGSGKSSLVKAGVIPKLLSSHEVIETRPAKNPFAELARCVTKICEERKYSEADIGYFAKEIESKNPKDIHRVLERLFKEQETELLLYVDQFEELFTLCDKDLQKSFTDTLLYLADNQSSHLKIDIVFTMRRDYYNLLSDYKEFDSLIQGTTYLVKRMKDKNLKEVIEKPLELLNVDVLVIQKLSSIILDDMGDESKEITLLQIALTETWERKSEYSHDLIASYVGIGKVTGALSTLAMNAMQSLNETEKELFKYIFIRVVKFSDMGGITRRLAEREEFSDEAWALVQRLASAYDNKQEKYKSLGRLLKLRNVKEKSVEEVTELVHEALVTQWSTYVKWLREINQENRKRIHDALIDKSKIYKKDSQSKFLLTGYTLEESSKLLDEGYKEFLSFDERFFIEASEKREKQIRFWKRTGVSTLVFLVLLSASFAYWVNIIRKDIKSMVYAFARTNSRICGDSVTNVIEVYKEVAFRLEKNNQVQYLGYVYSELGDNHSFKKEWVKAILNYKEALKQCKNYIKLKPNSGVNYNNIFELELILGYDVDNEFEANYISKFQNNFKTMRGYEMLKVLRKIVRGKRVNLDIWEEYSIYNNLNWRFSSLYIWANQIRDKEIKGRIFEALKVFDRRYYSNKLYYERKMQ